MRIQNFSLYPYQIPLLTGQTRTGVLIHLIDEKEKEGWGETAPLPKWSQETFEDALLQLNQIKNDVTQIEWTAESCLEQLAALNLLPSVLFGLESGILSLLSPLPAYTVPTSALLMGSSQEILEQAQLRHREGYKSAKLKVSQVNLDEAAQLIHQLKDKFRLRIDVNRAWKTEESLQFFSQFPFDTFDYVEEPFENPHDLAQFSHPLAIDESFPQNLSLEELEAIPHLKALIYKPTIQGGLLNGLPLHEWTSKRGIALVLSSSFESDIGLSYVASIAHRLSLSVPVGLGTYHYLQEYLGENFLQFSQAMAHVSSPIKIARAIEFNNNPNEVYL